MNTQKLMSRPAIGTLATLALVATIIVAFKSYVGALPVAVVGLYVSWNGNQKVTMREWRLLGTVAAFVLLWVGSGRIARAFPNTAGFVLLLIIAAVAAFWVPKVWARLGGEPRQPMPGAKKFAVLATFLLLMMLMPTASAQGVGAAVTSDPMCQDKARARELVKPSLGLASIAKPVAKYFKDGNQDRIELTTAKPKAEFVGLVCLGGKLYVPSLQKAQMFMEVLGNGKALSWGDVPGGPTSVSISRATGTLGEAMFFECDGDCSEGRRTLMTSEFERSEVFGGEFAKAAKAGKAMAVRFTVTYTGKIPISGCDENSGNTVKCAKTQLVTRTQSIVLPMKVSDAPKAGFAQKAKEVFTKPTKTIVGLGKSSVNTIVKAKQAVGSAIEKVTPGPMKPLFNVGQAIQNLFTSKPPAGDGAKSCTLLQKLNPFNKRC